MASIEELKATRIAKLELLKKAGINPYPSKVPRTFCLADARANFVEYEKEKKELSLAGRVMAIRGQGAILFVVLMMVKVNSKRYLKKTK